MVWDYGEHDRRGGKATEFVVRGEWRAKPGGVAKGGQLGVQLTWKSTEQKATGEWCEGARHRAGFYAAV